jgi:hypothetical protein
VCVCVCVARANAPQRAPFVSRLTFVGFSLLALRARTHQLTDTMTSSAAEEGATEIRRLLKEGAAVGRPEGLAVTVGPCTLTLRDWRCKFAVQHQDQVVCTARRDLVRDLEQLLERVTTPPPSTTTPPSTARGAKRLRVGKESDDACSMVVPMPGSPESSPRRPLPRLFALSPSNRSRPIARGPPVPTTAGTTTTGKDAITTTAGTTTTTTKGGAARRAALRAEIDVADAPRLARVWQLCCAIRAKLDATVNRSDARTAAVHHQVAHRQAEDVHPRDPALRRLLAALDAADRMAKHLAVAEADVEARYAEWRAVARRAAP